MAYRFRPGESTASEFSRIAREELDAAIELLTTSDKSLDERVHDARKHLKKLRGLLALAASALDGEKLERERLAIRTAARSLADLRGRAALVEAFEALVGQAPDGLGQAARASIRARLDASSAEDGAAARALDGAAAALSAARERLPELELAEDGWDALEAGFRKTYARARRAGERARKHPRADVLHRFRTPAKRHFYQIHLLEPLFPELLGAHRRELSRLGDLLGDHHDLALLCREIEPCDLGDERARVNALVDRRREELEHDTFALEARLFAEKPRALSRRFARYFAAARA